MNVYFDDNIGLVLKPEGLFDKSLNAPLLANMADHFYLWSHITLDFDYVEAIDSSGVRLLLLLHEKIQNPKQKIQIININDFIMRKLKADSIDYLFHLEAKQIANRA